MKATQLTRLRHLARLNPPTPEFAAAAADAPVTFLPLEAVWPHGLDVSRTRPKREVEGGYTRFREGDILVPKITPTFEADRSVIARACATVSDAEPPSCMCSVVGLPSM